MKDVLLRSEEYILRYEEHRRRSLLTDCDTPDIRFFDNRIYEVTTPKS